jgi:hypothetical protein
VADLVRQHVHDLGPTAERRRWVAVAHRLGEGAEIGFDAEELRRASPGEAEPGLDLVEDEQDPEFLPWALPRTGSTMIAAISSPRCSNSRRSGSIRL